jgi:HK97 family phage major capsid protein
MQTLQVDEPGVKVLSPATYSSVRLQHIKGEKFGLKAHERAYALGMWARGAFLHDPAGAKFCEQNGIKMLAHMEGDQGAGGWLVPEQVSTDIIDIREEFSPFRQYADVEPMTSDHATFPVAKGGLKAYPVGEGQDATESQVSGDSISLTAKKWLVWARNSSELSEDAFISWADKMSYEMGRAFAEAEADCGFSGDGTTTYHGIMGIVPALKAQDDTIANIPGLQVASGNAWGEIILNDFISTTAKVSNRTIRGGDLRWYCSQQFYTNVMVKLAMAAGGNAAGEIVNGVARHTFLGYPVVITPALPTTESNSSVPCLFGSIRDAVKFGDRKGVSLFMTEHLYAKSDMVAWRGRERFDINCWNLGDKNASSPDSKFGGVAGLIMAAS